MTETEFQHKIFSLSERLFPMVYRILGNSEKAKDAIQEIMMKLWIKRKQIEKHPNLKALVFLTARNYCIDLLRKKRVPIDDYSLQFVRLESESGQDQLEWEELNNVIMEILKSLPKQQREVLIMRDIDGYEFTEIAAITQLKVKHVRVLLSRARKEVSLQLEKVYHYER